jgi:very-long-chain enoyl-CoA reductase
MIFAAAFLAHFTRRLYENRFVHIFSKAYTPPSDLVIDCAYYWGFAAVVGYAVNFGECVEPSWTIMGNIPPVSF